MIVDYIGLIPIIILIFFLFKEMRRNNKLEEENKGLKRDYIFVKEIKERYMDKYYSLLQKHLRMKGLIE